MSRPRTALWTAGIALLAALCCWGLDGAKSARQTLMAGALAVVATLIWGDSPRGHGGLRELADD